MCNILFIFSNTFLNFFIIFVSNIFLIGILIKNRDPPSGGRRSRAKAYRRSGRCFLFFTLTRFSEASPPEKPVAVCPVCKGDHSFRQCPRMTGGCFHCPDRCHRISQCPVRHIPHRRVRIARFPKACKATDQISEVASVYLAAVLEYVAAEFLDLAGDVATDMGKSVIGSRHLQLAVCNDEELMKLMESVTVASRCG